MGLPEGANMEGFKGILNPFGAFLVFIFEKIKKEELIMATKKLIGVTFGILVISAWILGAVVQVGAETLKGRNVLTTTKYEQISVSDEPGHVLAILIREGLAFFENGEIAKMRNHSILDTTPGKDSQAINYNIFTYEDGSTVVTRTQRLLVPDKSGNFSAKTIGKIIKPESGAKTMNKLYRHIVRKY